MRRMARRTSSSLLVPGCAAEVGSELDAGA